MHLPKSLAAWNTDAFDRTLKEELRAAGGGALPLQQAVRATSIALDDEVEVMILRKAEAADGAIDVDVGVFYAGLVAGCSCADDPTPVEPQPEYCELNIAIDRRTAAARVRAREQA